MELGRQGSTEVSALGRGSRGLCLAARSLGFLILSRCADKSCYQPEIGKVRTVCRPHVIFPVATPFPKLAEFTLKLILTDSHHFACHLTPKYGPKAASVALRALSEFLPQILVAN